MRAIRAGICALAAFAVLAHGAVETWSEGVLEIAAAVLFLYWLFVVARQREIVLRWHWLFAPALCLVLLAGVQYLASLSAYPYATKVELLRVGAYLLLAFLAVQSFQTIEHIRGFVWFVVGLGFVVSLLGIVQHLTFNGKLYWIRPLHYGGSPFGPFVNHHHFAGFVELIAPFGLALLAGAAVRQEKRLLLALLTVVPIGALILTTSRGGIASFVLQVVLLGLLLGPDERRAKRLRWAAALAVAVGALVAWIGADAVLRRLESSNAQAVSRDRRVAMFWDTWRIFLDHPVAGTGLGTLRTVYPQYESHYDGRIVDHAHNDYLELLADTGVVGGALGLGFAVLLLLSAGRNLRSANSPLARAFYRGSMVACAGLMVHSLVDFNFRIPSNALLFLLIAFLASGSTEQPAQSD